MAVVENRFICDLKKPVQAQALKGNVFSLDNLGSRLSVLIYDNGVPATISGSVTANCILPDGSTVNINGSLGSENGGSKAYVDIPQSCLLIPGVLKIAIKITSSSVVTTLAAIVANVYMTKTDNVITPSQQLINDWNAEVSAAIAEQDAAITAQDEKIADLNSEIKLITGNELFNNFTIGKYITTSGDNATIGTMTINASYACQVIDCSAGDVFMITGKGGASPRLWAFLGADNSGSRPVLSKADANANKTDLVITAPANSQKLVINVLIANPYYIASGILAINKITEAQGDIEDIKTEIGVEEPGITVVSGHYIYANADRTSDNFSRSAPIAVSKDEIVRFTATGYSTTVAMIALSNAAGTSFTDVVRSTDGNQHTYEYTVLDDGYIVVSWLNSSPYSLVIMGTRSNGSLLERVDTLYNKNLIPLVDDATLTVKADDTSATMSDTGHFINQIGTYASSTGFNISAAISLKKGDYIKFNAKGYLTNVSVLARKDGTVYTPLVISEDSDEHTFSYNVMADMDVVISTQNTVNPKYSIYTSKMDKNAVDIAEMTNDEFAFAKIGVIGDSLASGATNFSGGAADRPEYSWGKFIEREHGINVNLFSKGGANTRTWLSSAWGLTALQAADVLDCYILALGVNDEDSLGSSYLGSSSDVHVGSESQNADTYYGNYSKIIAAIKTKSPRAKIFCVTNPRDNTQLKKDFNNAIKTIVGMYTNTYLIDLAADSFYTSKEFTSTWYVAHSTAVGYKLIARNIYNHISEIIRFNTSDFLDIQWIIENHA